jgi:hypothetical protein
VFGNLEMNVAERLAWLTVKRHIGFLWGTVTLFNVALQTRGNDVLPDIRAAPRPGNDVIDSQVVPPIAAILASVTIPVQYIATRQTDFLVWDLYVSAQANYSWQGKIGINQFAIMLNLLGLTL